MSAKKPKPSKKHSIHRDGKLLVAHARNWRPMHIEAGYHEQEWGELPTRDHDLLGQHEHLHVAYVPPEEAHTGAPEFRITLDSRTGEAVNVVCADSVRAYLELHGVK
jgi:hypothetical protein